MDYWKGFKRAGSWVKSRKLESSSVALRIERGESQGAAWVRTLDKWKSLCIAEWARRKVIKSECVAWIRSQ